MQVLTAKCPYCKHEVDSTIDHLQGPVVCPSCNKPFEIRMPTAIVTSVHEVDANKANSNRMATEPEERILARVNPVVFRARPVASVILALVFLIAVVAIVMSLAGMSVSGFSLNETMILGPASLLIWACGITLLMIVGIVGYWTLLSQFTTLTVTDNRTIYKRGLLSRETSEVQHDDVRNIQLQQSFVERLLGIGDVSISSSGQGDLEVVARRLPNPGRIIELIRANQA